MQELPCNFEWRRHQYHLADNGSLWSHWQWVPCGNRNDIKRWVWHAWTDSHESLRGRDETPQGGSQRVSSIQVSRENLEDTQVGDCLQQMFWEVVHVVPVGFLAFFWFHSSQVQSLAFTMYLDRCVTPNTIPLRHSIPPTISHHHHTLLRFGLLLCIVMLNVNAKAPKIWLPLGMRESLHIPSNAMWPCSLTENYWLNKDADSLYSRAEERQMGLQFLGLGYEEDHHQRREKEMVERGEDTVR